MQHQCTHLRREETCLSHFSSNFALPPAIIFQHTSPMKHLPLFFQKDNFAFSKHTLLRSILFWIALLTAHIAYTQQPFITTWKTDNTASGSSNGTSIIIPTFSGDVYNYDVDWNNDGTYEQTGISGSAAHNFGVAGTYTIRIRGTFPRIYFANSNDYRKLLDVVQWGDIAWTSMNSAFYNCVNLQVSATDMPDLSGVTALYAMFYNCASLTGPANIGNWTTDNVTNTAYMFTNAQAFNQPIANWITTSVTDMSNMFYGTQAFNQPIGNWNTANVTTMNSMFYEATAFNQPIGTWNTSSVVQMPLMFFNATAFNQPIGAWNTAAVTSMGSMFSGATAFNQSLGTWTLRPAGVSLNNMLNGSGLDCTNYSTTLIGWNNNAGTPNGRTLGAAARQYDAGAVAARTNLITNKGWTINGDAACFVLPVELVAFTGKQQEDGILLEWQTAAEQNNRGFYIERSVDGLRWTDIGFVASQGTTTEMQDYSFLDEKTRAPTNYYRLRQTDFDGREELSEVVHVELKNAGTVHLFPNPVSNGELILFLPENSEAVTVQLFSPAGQLLRSVRLDRGNLTLNVAGLPTGIYTLQAGHSFEKIVVQN